VIELLGERNFFSRRNLSVHLGYNWKFLKKLADHAGRFYRCFDEPTVGKPREQWRHLDVPTRQLRSVQRRIARFLRSRVVLPDTMQGGVLKGSPKRNASFHLGQKIVFKLDIRDCFPSIGHKRVFCVFREQLMFSDEISRVLTKLTTFQRRLPQGAPTSSILANLALLPLHDEIQRACKPLEVRCTFFVDDIVLSGDRVREVAGSVVSLVRKHGFSMRAQKVGLLVRHREAQKVTGIVVNGRRLSVGRRRQSELRLRILRMSRAGRVFDSDLRSIWSSVSQVKHVSPSQGAALEKLSQERLPEHGLRSSNARPSKHWHVCKATRKHRRKSSSGRRNEVQRVPDASGVS